MAESDEQRSFLVQASARPEEDAARISAGLSAFNRTRIPDRGYARIVLTLSDSRGEFAGGLSGYVAYGWLFIDSLWVAEHARSQGQGRNLMLAAEEEARKHGCRNAWVDTFSFQARDFYERLGYQIFGELEDFPPGHRRYFMRKSLS